MTKIAYLDLSAGGQMNLNKITYLPIEILQAQILQDTGRELTFNESDRLDLIGIVKYDSPVGYGVFAIKDIEKDTPLFFCGGEMTDHPVDVHSPYVRAIHEDETAVLDASQRGGIGSLCSHLPQPYHFDLIKISKSELDKLQFENLQIKPIKQRKQFDLLKVAKTYIPKGSILGSSYGWQYWFHYQTSPVMFSQSSNLLNNISIQKPMYCLILQSKLGLNALQYSYEQLRMMLNISSKYLPESSRLILMQNHKSLQWIYMNKTHVRSALLLESTTNLCHYLYAKDITKIFSSKQHKQESHALLSLSVFANKTSRRGPFQDALIDSEMPEYEMVDIPNQLSIA